MSKPQLFLLHFAGGNCYSFQFMRSYLPEFEFIPLELPGRGKRINERLLTDLNSASGDIFNQIRTLLKADGCVIYGHSMGAVLALKVAALLEAQDKPAIQVVVTGNPGPGVKRDKLRSLMVGEEFKNELREIGGMPEEVLSSKEMFDFFEPVLRADFKVAEGLDSELPSPIHAPIYAIMGSREEHVDEIATWRQFTRSRFEARIMDGGHFFIRDHVRSVAAILKDCYQQYVTGAAVRNGWPQP